MNPLRNLCAVTLLTLPCVVTADTGALFADGPFAAIMARGVQYDSRSDLDTGFGGMLSGGARRGPVAFEIGGTYTAGGNGAKALGGAFRGMFFPFDGSGLYALAGAGLQNVQDHPNLGNIDFNLVTVDAGLGYLFPIKFGARVLGLRAELFYEYGDRQDRDQDQRPPQPELDVPDGFNNVVLQFGLHVPLGALPVPPAAPEAVALVAPVLICSDGLDNDGDGLIDFPADPGCTGTDDGDETDPPQCSDGKDNDGDGLVDFPADKGCTGADDNDEVDPCKTPAVGERVSLKGCGLGDVIVLRGVNFEFDKDRLTVNAKTILDNVAEELVAYPEITIELGGHTDAKGSDEYNQALSDRRAASVVRYLKGKDIAAERMSSAGYGEAQPVADNETDEGRELNRRVELKITSGVAPGSTTTSDGSSTTVTEGVSTEPAVEAPAADAPAADATPVETPEVAPTAEQSAAGIDDVAR